MRTWIRLKNLWARFGDFNDLQSLLEILDIKAIVNSTIWGLLMAATAWFGGWTLPWIVLASAAVFLLVSVAQVLQKCAKAPATDPNNLGKPLAPTTGLRDQIVEARRRLAQRRGELEKAMHGAGGRMVAHEFTDKMLPLRVRTDAGDTVYDLPISSSGPTAIWVNPKLTKQIKRVARSLDNRGDLVDVPGLREARDSFTLEIGQRAFFTMSDDRIVQLLVVRVRYYAAGDDADEAHLRYQIHDPDDFLVRAI